MQVLLQADVARTSQPGSGFHTGMARAGDSRLGARAHQEHLAISEAILSRDSAIARQRMLRHLEGASCAQISREETGT